MNNSQRGKRAGAGRLLALGALLCVATGLGGARAAGAEPPAPAQLRMTLSPGRADASTITFSTEDGKRTRGELEQVFAPEPEGQAAGRIEAAAPPDPLWGGRKTAADIAYQPEVSLRAGYRRDHLQWSIADVDNNPNVLSELDFDHVDSLALAGDLRWSNSSKLFLRGAFDIGWRQNGNVQDSDYLGNDRTMEFSRSYADVEGGSFFDLSAGLGYRFDIPLRAEERVLRLIPLAGYSYHSQEFEITNGYQALAEYGFKAKPGPIRGLHSWYDAKWYGPWLGLDVDFSVNRRHALLLSLEYHWIDYEADANWNLRSDLAHPVSFEHDSNGEGYILSLAYKYSPNSRWFWTVGASYSSMEADPGFVRTYSADGSDSSTQLNRVEWDSFALTAGLGFYF